MIQNRLARKLLPALALGATCQIGAAAPAAIGDEAISSSIDSILQNTDKLDGLVRRSIKNGGSKPVSFAGEADAKLVGSSFLVAPQWMLADKSEFKNSLVTIRMAMVAKPHRNLTLWSKLAFSNALLGYSQPRTVDPGLDSLVGGDNAWKVSPSAGDANDKRGAVLYEDMAVGMIMSAGPVSFNFKAGGVLWNEMSPLTVWKTQPRMFGWDYLPYELEQSTAMFYDYATVKGFKEGRAAWNKKPFQGLQLESIELPWNLYMNTLYGFYEGYLKNYAWMVPPDKTNELQYTDPNGSVVRTGTTKATGIGDNYRAMWLLRLAKAEIPGGVTAGVNWFQYMVDKDYPLQWAKSYGYSLTGPSDVNVITASAPTYGKYRVDGVRGVVWDDTLPNGSRYVNNYYLEPRVGSMDFKRTLPGGLNFHVDIGASYVDSVWFKVGATVPRTTGMSVTTGRFNTFVNEELDSVVNRGVKVASNAVDTTVLYNELAKYDPRFRNAVANALPWTEVGRTNTGWKPAVYASVSYPFPAVDAELRVMYADKDFHSGASTVAPIDGIFPYESNLTGPGKFGGADNGTSYTANLTGLNAIVKIPVPRGHARLSSGFHTQVKAGNDLIWFPWRQNGTAFSASMNSDFTRYGVGLADDYWRSTAGAENTPAEMRMIRRLGDESFFRTSIRNPYAPTPGFAGGMRADYMAIYEGFAAYKLSSTFRDSIRAGAGISSADSVVWRQIAANQDSNYFRAQHKKSTQSFSADASWEVSQLWGGKQSLFLAGYAAFNSITDGPGMGIPAFTTGDKVFLVGRNLRFEPVFQLTPRFYLIGLVTQEVWKSDFGVAMLDSTTGLAPSSDDQWMVQDGSGNLSATNLYRAPIDYTDWMYGLGFDWDIAPRVSLHVRGQYFTHEDAGISVDVPTAKGRNDYRAWLGSTEMKMWF